MAEESFVLDDEDDDCDVWTPNSDNEGRLNSSEGDMRPYDVRPDDHEERCSSSEDDMMPDDRDFIEVEKDFKI